MIVVEVLFWVALAALVWTHVALPARRAPSLARVRRAAGPRRGGRLPSRDGDRRRAQRGDRDRAAAREPARARLPGRQARDRRHLGRLDRPHRRARRGGRRPRAARAADPLPARRQGRRAGPRRPRDRAARSSRSPTRTRPGRRTRCAKLVRSFADPDVAYVCGRLVLTDAAGSNREGVYWRYETWLRAQESALGSVTGGNGSIYAVRRSRLRRGRPALRARPLAAVPDGAARPARGLRPGGDRVREADAGDRDRVPAQGAHVRALLADRPARQDAPPPAAGLPRRDPLAPAPPLRQRPAAPVRCSGRTSRSSRCGPASSTTSLLGLQLAFFALAALRRGLPRYYALVTWATVVSLWNYLRRGVPATWDAAEGDAVRASRSTSTSARRLIKTHGNLYRGARADALPDPAVPARGGQGRACSTSAQLGPLDDRRCAGRLPADRDRPRRRSRSPPPAALPSSSRWTPSTSSATHARCRSRTASFDVVHSYSVLQHLPKEDVLRSPTICGGAPARRPRLDRDAERARPAEPRPAAAAGSPPGAARKSATGRWPSCAGCSRRSARSS